MHKRRIANLILIIVSSLFFTACGRNNLFTGSSDSLSLVGLDFLVASSPVVVQAGGLNYTDASTFTFGTVTEGTSSPTVSFTIQNTGTGDIVFSGIPIVISGNDAADFTFTGPDNPVVPPGGTATFTVNFTPGGAGPRDCVITVFSSNGNELYSVNLTGNGSTTAVPDIFVQSGSAYYASGSTYVFGTVTQGTSSTPATFTIQNPGAGILTLTGSPAVSVGGANSSDFIVSGPAGSVISPGMSDTFTVTFTPSAVGARSAVITIQSDDPDVGSYMINLIGTGAPVPIPDINLQSGTTAYPTGGSYDFGSAVMGTTKTWNYVLQNTGTGTLTVTGVTISGTDAADFYISGLTSTSIAVGDSVPYAIVFTPGALGGRTAVLTIMSDDPDEGAYTITISGTGTSAPAPIATISGQPTGVNNASTLNVDVAGADVQYYQYKVGTTGATDCTSASGYSAAIAESANITDTISALGDGSITLCVVGQNSFATWQPYTAATAATWTRDTTAPPGYSVNFIPAIINTANQAACSFSITGAEIGATYDFSINGSVSGSGLITSATQTISGIDVSGLPDGILSLSVNLTDAAGNTGSPAANTVMKDATPPIGYSAGIDQTYINTGNAAALSVTFAGAEVGSNYTYTISSSGGGGPVTGSGAVGSPGLTLSGIDVSGLGNGTLTLSFVLTDTPGNTGIAATDAAVKDTNVPSGYSVNINQTAINGSNQTNFSFTFAGAEVGAAYNYSITGGGTISGSGTVSSTNETVSGINVSPLSDGTLTLSVTLTDTAGNAGAAATDTVIKDVTAPSGYSVAIDQASINTGNATALSFTCSGTETGTAYAYTITSTGGGTPVIGNGTITGPTQNVSGINVSGLGDGTLTLNFFLTDTAGNAGTSATGTVAKDALPPVVVITGPAGGSAVNGTAVISFTDSELTAPEVSVDNASWHSATSGVTTLGSISLFMGLPQGAFTLYLRDTDGGGSTGTTSVSLVKDTIAPTVAFTSTPAITAANQNTYTVSGNCSEIGRLVSVNIGGSVDTVTCLGGTFTRTTDISWYGEAPVTMTADHSDAAGNAASEDVSTVTKDTIAPVLVITAPSAGATVKGSESINFSDTETTSPEVSFNGATWYPLVNGMPLSAISPFFGLPEAGFNLYIRDTDTVGNIGSYSIGLIKDTMPPTGYTVSIDQAYINAGNVSALSFTFAGAEPGTTYNYSISGGGTISGSGTVSSAGETVSGIDVSVLWNSTLTLNVTLTDAAGNIGVIASATVEKDTSPPGGYTVSFDQAYVNSTNAGNISFTYSGAETGTTYHYTITSSGGGTNITGSGTSFPSQSISGINCAGLGDGTLTVYFYLTDTAGNDGTMMNNTVMKDTVPPTVSITAPSAITYTNRLGYTVSGSCTAFGSPVYVVIGGLVSDSPNCASGSYTTAALDVSSLADGMVNITADHSDAAGNSAPQASTSVTKQTAPIIDVQVGGSSVTSHDFGTINTPLSSVPVAFTIQNTGTGDLNISPYTLGGSNPTDFIVSGLSTCTIAGGGSKTFTIIFKPVLTASRTAQLTIHSNDADKVIDLSGWGGSIMLPHINVKVGTTDFASGSSFDFGTVQKNTAKTVTFTIQNTGVGGLVLTGKPSVGTSYFIVNSPSAINIPGGGSATFTVAFVAPGTPGVYADTVMINSNDTSNNPYTINIGGISSNSLIPDIEVSMNGIDYLSGSTYDFGDIWATGTTEASFIILNRGTTSLNVSFSWDSGGTMCYLVYSGPTSVPPGTTTTVYVDFSPNLAGMYNDTLRINSDDPDENPYLINFTGRGSLLPVPDINVEVASVSYPSGSTFEFETLYQSPTTVTFEIWNHGTADLEIYPPYAVLSGIFAGDYSITSYPAPIVPAGASTTMDVMFTPGAKGLRPATIMIPTNDPDESTYAVNLKGIPVLPMLVVHGNSTSSTSLYDPTTNSFDNGISMISTVSSGSHSYLIQSGINAGRYMTIHGNGTATTLYNPADQSVSSGPSTITGVGSGGNSFMITAGSNSGQTMLVCGGTGTASRLYNPSSDNFSNSIATFGPTVGSGSFNFTNLDNNTIIVAGNSSPYYQVFNQAANTLDSTWYSISTASVSSGGHAFKIDSGSYTNYMLIIEGGGFSNRTWLVNLSATPSIFTGPNLTGTAGAGAFSIPIKYGPNAGLVLIVHGGGLQTTSLYHTADNTITSGPTVSSGSVGDGAFYFEITGGAYKGMYMVANGGTFAATAIFNPHTLGFFTTSAMLTSDAGAGAHAIPAR